MKLYKDSIAIEEVKQRIKKLKKLNQLVGIEGGMLKAMPLKLKKRGKHKQIKGVPVNNKIKLKFIHSLIR
jgi:hypothetical protein